jgi:hypothetical protein
VGEEKQAMKRAQDQSALSTTKRVKFLKELATSGNVTHSAATAGLDRKTVYNWYESDVEFAKAWNDALEQAGDILEAEARRRAAHGVDEPIVWQGKVSATWINDRGEVVAEGTPGAKQIPLTVKKYSDTLLIFLLKGAKPAKYRDNVDVTSGGKPIVTTSPQVLQDAKAVELMDALADRMAGRN